MEGKHPSQVLLCLASLTQESWPPFDNRVGDARDQAGESLYLIATNTTIAHSLQGLEAGDLGKGKVNDQSCNKTQRHQRILLNAPFASSSSM